MPQYRGHDLMYISLLGIVTGWFKEDGDENRNTNFFNKANSRTGKRMRQCV